MADRIRVEYCSTPEFEAAVEAHRDFIMNEVLAEEMLSTEISGEEYVLNGQPTRIRLTNLSAK